MKGFIVISLLLLPVVFVQAQQEAILTLEECYELAKSNYPLIKKRELINRSKGYSIENAAKAQLPQLNINGQATYQSAVTEIPLSMPGVEIPQLTKDQYRIYGEVNQSIYDGGTIRQEKESIRISAALQEQSLEVELYKLKERVNQLFFGVLMVDEHLMQNQLMEADIKLGLKKVKAAIKNGAALKSEADILEAERLKVIQRGIELVANRKAYMEMLGMFVNTRLDGNVALEKPTPSITPATINRPELALYDFQLQHIAIQENFINARNKPKVDFFFQGGYGRPALNILNPGFEAYYIGGVRLSWNIAGWYTSKKEKAILQNNRLEVASEKETFLFNTQHKVRQEQAEIDRYQQLLRSDDEIIELRSRIKTSSFAQLENGVINTSDYLRELNAEDQARTNKILHEIQLLYAQHSNLNTTGN
ncbi:TolC family protein [Olivibacter sp. SDN3]|uniref:TolC family protein n=1 Tax=Olivibacter sp. SDN3 TaxID=2764720 RepID=UPI0016518BBD|nr:TolC family protein [Olivibacter sp. SDN3]QNL49601.1 TolC family protein [Olivibacter sp. SDN3]